MPIPSSSFAPVLLLLRAERWAEAEAALKALPDAADDPHVPFHLGTTQLMTGRPQDAAASWRLALAIEPRFVPAMVNLGTLALRAGDHQEALRYTAMAAAAEPGNPARMLNLALAESAVGRQRQALTTIDRGLLLRTGDLPLLHLRLQTLRRLELWEEALTTARRLLALPGGDGFLPSLYNAVLAACRLSDWPFATRHLPRLHELAARPDAELNPLGAALTCDDPALLRTLAENEARALPRRPRPARRAHGGPPVVGYLSPDLHDHPVAHMLLTALRHHDRARVRVVLVDLFPADLLPADDAVRRELLARCDGRLDLAGLADDDAAALLAREVDVLVDLVGVATHARPALVAARPCAAQVLWLGCATTTGRACYDAFLLDAVTAPAELDRHCSEPLVRLPCCFHPISAGWLDGGNDDLPDAAGLPPVDGSGMARAALGLPADGVVVALLQQPERIMPAHIAAIAAVLAREPRAHLWLRVVKSARGAARAHLAALGLPAERVHFTWRFPARTDHLAALRLADLVVDSSPYGGHSGTGECLALGVPVLATAGRGIHARIAAGMLHELGLGDLLAPDPAALLATLARLVGEPPLLAAWRERFRAAAAVPPAARHRRLAAALEDAYVGLLADAAPAG